jgi:hypothetical protein
MDARTHARSRLRPVYHRVLGALPTDPTRGWRATALDGEPALRVAYFGDCSFRAMDRSHGVHNPIGWPRVLASQLLERGERMEFSAVFVPRFEALPGPEDLDRHLRLTGAPDVVFVQLGALYQRRTVLPDSPRFLRLREDVGRRLGNHVFTGYRAMRPAVRVLGRQRTPYRGVDGLERFLAVARDAWPRAATAVIPVHPRVPALPVQRAIGARVHADTLAACRRAGVETIELADVVLGPGRLRCANGYNLNSAGSELAGTYIADWLSRRASSGATGPAARSAC